MATKELALEKAQQGKQLLLDRWRDFREESPYFQAKVGLVAAWIVVTVFTIILVPPSPENFLVEQKMVNFGLAEKATLIVLNQAAGDIDVGLVEVRGTMTDFDGKKTAGTWVTKPIAIPMGLKTTLSTEAFFDSKGANPGYELRIDHVVIKDDGDEVWSGPPGSLTPKK